VLKEIAVPRLQLLQRESGRVFENSFQLGPAGFQHFITEMEDSFLPRVAFGVTFCNGVH